MTAWNCPLQALTEAGMRVKFVSKKVCKRLTRWTNYTRLGTWGLPFSEARILTREHVYQKRWAHFREFLLKKPMVFPNCQPVYKWLQVLNKCLN